MANPTALITIKSDYFDPNIHVTIGPLPTGEALNFEFDRYPDAKQYAEHLAVQNDWLMIDLVGAQTDLQMLGCR